MFLTAGRTDRRRHGEATYAILATAVTVRFFPNHELLPLLVDAQTVPDDPLGPDE